MKFLFKISSIMASLLLANASYALDVDVSTSADATGVGFTVNGAKHGGPGSSYSTKDMPAGKYQFGIRIDNKDVPCLVNGKKRVHLSKNTKAVLNYKNKHCTASIQ